MWSIMSFKSFKSLGFKITIHLSDIFSYYTVGKLVKFFSGSQMEFGNETRTVSVSYKAG